MRVSAFLLITLMLPKVPLLFFILNTKGTITYSVIYPIKDQ